jgi:prepilin signal peptidase PulO-like enzyme (type II secretory pathway)
MPSHARRFHMTQLEALVALLCIFTCAVAGAVAPAAAQSLLARRGLCRAVPSPLRVGASAASAAALAAFALACATGLSTPAGLPLGDAGDAAGVVCTERLVSATAIGWFLLVCSFCDVEGRVLPNGAVAGLAVCALALRIATGGIAGGLAAGAASSGMLALCGALVGRGSVGAGDVKLAFPCALAAGADGLLGFLFVTAATSAAWACVGLASGRIRRGGTVAYGPFLALGAAAALSMGV